MPAREPVLTVTDLTITYAARRGRVQAVRGASFEVRRGEALALIGESGSGKTTAGLGLVRMLPSGAAVQRGEITFHDRRAGAIDVLGLSPAEMRDFRWRRCAMVFQGALNAFNPVLRISEQFADTARAHRGLQGQALAERAARLFELVRLDADRVWRAYPHELSGGMRQRVLIALSLLLEPPLIVFDEPTTALDILTQRNIMDVLKALRQTIDFSLIFISHDLSLAAELADRVATMYAGRVVEIGPVEAVFTDPAHPYTIGLIGAVPTLHGHRDDLASIPGAPPDLIALPGGCKFHPRCPLADARCRSEEPALEPVAEDHAVACWHWPQARATLRRPKRSAA
jgi:peptide/nickel transport system ATP-binding protein